jgi:hypothetical protein
VLQEDVADVEGARDEVLAMLGEFRRSLLLVPVRDGGVLTGDQGGLRWIYAFTGTDTLTAFAHGRGEAGEWEYQRIYGARLLDETLPEIGVPCGVAVDVGSEGAFLLPPVQGIVPDAAALPGQAAVTGESEGTSA